MLTIEQKARIRQNREGWTYKQWASHFNVPYNKVWRTVNGRYSSVAGRHYRQSPGRRLSPNEVRAIRQNRHGKTFEQLADDLGVSKFAVYYAYHGVTYKDVA